MEMLIKSPDEKQEFFTDEQCHILELLNEEDDRSQSIARARVAPGVSTSLHKLIATSETYFILSGNGEVELNNNIKQKVTRGDVVRIPAEMPQRISNTGDEDLVFLCFCVPAFSQENYVSI